MLSPHYCISKGQTFMNGSTKENAAFASPNRCLSSTPGYIWLDVVNSSYFCTSSLDWASEYILLLKVALFSLPQFSHVCVTSLDRRARFAGKWLFTLDLRFFFYLSRTTNNLHSPPKVDIAVLASNMGNWKSGDIAYRGQSLSWGGNKSWEMLGAKKKKITFLSCSFGKPSYSLE